MNLSLLFLGKPAQILKFCFADLGFECFHFGPGYFNKQKDQRLEAGTCFCSILPLFVSCLCLYFLLVIYKYLCATQAQGTINGLSNLYFHWVTNINQLQLSHNCVECQKSKVCYAKRMYLRQTRPSQVSGEMRKAPLRKRYLNQSQRSGR